MSQRIVITGLGWVTPFGDDLDTVWKHLLAGDAAASDIRYFDASTFPTTFTAQVPESYDWTQYVNDPAVHKGIGRNIMYALGAARHAVNAAGLSQAITSGTLDPERVGLYLGGGEGILDFEHYTAANLGAWNADDRKIDAAKWAPIANQRFDPAYEASQEPNFALTHLALEYNARGPAYNCLTACAASTQAIGEAADLMRNGMADVMITGGCHTMIHPLGITGFNRLTALSNRNDDPKTASRPFSADRDGFVMGEGSGILILETLDHALERGATPLAEVVGYGSTADAYRITDIHPEGAGAAAAMRLALADAGLEPHHIDYISAHGTSTKENDSIETKAVKAVFGDCPNGPPPMSSIKSMMGHLIAAAGSVEAITCVLALRDQILPPTMNLHNRQAELDLDYVANQARPASVRTVMSNNFGFGGQNDTLIMTQYQP